MVACLNNIIKHISRTVVRDIGTLPLFGACGTPDYPPFSEQPNANSTKLSHRTLFQTTVVLIILP